MCTATAVTLLSLLDKHQPSVAVPCSNQLSCNVNRSPSATHQGLESTQKEISEPQVSTYTCLIRRVLVISSRKIRINWIDFLIGLSSHTQVKCATGIKENVRNATSMGELNNPCCKVGVEPRSPAARRLLIQNCGYKMNWAASSWGCLIQLVFNTKH